MLCFSVVCKAQEGKESIPNRMAMFSRAKADAVLKNFDTLQAPKILYSLEDRYYYLIIKDTPLNKEYYVALDSLGGIDKINLAKEETKTRKKQKQYRKLLSEAKPIFDLSIYHTGLITKLPDAKMAAGRLSYFVVKDINGKRYGEYSLSAITAPLPIDTNLWAYLVRNLSDELAKDSKAKR